MVIRYRKTKGNVVLIIVAFIWGSSFVAQKQGMEYIGPFTFNGLRSIIGAIVLTPVVTVSVRAGERMAKRSKSDSGAEKYTGAEVHSKDFNDAGNSLHEIKSKKGNKRMLIKGGLICGIVLFFASSFQQIGLLYTTSGKSGFITAFYIIIVPLLGRLIGRTVRPVLWFCAGIALIGLYLICIKDGFSINKGDLWTLACAFCYAIHILVIDRFSPEVNGVALSQIQFFVAGLISIPIMFATESADPGLLFDCWLPLCYSGIMSGGVGYTLQIIAQKHTEPTVACLIMSLEAAFALLTGWLVLGETMSAKEFIGCAVMFTAIVISQRPSRESSFN